MKRIALIATSDLVADQRVHRAAIALHEYGYHVTAIGRRLPVTPTRIERPYRVKLLSLPFRKGPLFYATYNIFAFFYLLFSRYHLVQANDLDTLLAARLACAIRRLPLIYDSHELFTEVPELIGRPNIQRVWAWLERNLIKGVKHRITVSAGVAKELEARYGLSFKVIRNVPLRKDIPSGVVRRERTLIYQGALNMGRGIERMIEAVALLPDIELLIAGTGDLDAELRLLAQKLGVHDRVIFLGRYSLDKLHGVTCSAAIGLSLEEDMGLNYRYALPNKVFDYIQAGLPVLVSDLPEMATLVKELNNGEVISSQCTPRELADTIGTMLSNHVKMAEWSSNSLSAAQHLNWENEREVLVGIAKRVFGNTDNTDVADGQR